MTYQTLLQSRQKTEAPAGFLNYADAVLTAIRADDVIDPFARWHGHQHPKVLLVGQDWGNVEYFRKHNGMDSDTNPTCGNLSALFPARARVFPRSRYW